MIQRIQSLYLLMTSLLSVLFLSGRYFTFRNNSGSEVIMNFRGIWEKVGEGTISQVGNLIPLLVALILASVTGFAAIFFFKNRKLQMKLTMASIILAVASIALMVFYAFWIMGKFQAVLVPGINMFIPLLILVFGILALRGTKKDEYLVKSYDRLR